MTRSTLESSGTAGETHVHMSVRSVSQPPPHQLRGSRRQPAVRPLCCWMVNHDGLALLRSAASTHPPGACTFLAAARLKHSRNPLGGPTRHMSSCRFWPLSCKLIGAQPHLPADGVHAFLNFFRMSEGRFEPSLLRNMFAFHVEVAP